MSEIAAGQRQTAAPALERAVHAVLQEGRAAATNKKLRLLFFSCGKEDPRMPFMAKVAEELRSRQLRVTLKSYPGEHE